MRAVTGLQGSGVPCWSSSQNSGPPGTCISALSSLQCSWGRGKEAELRPGGVSPATGACAGKRVPKSHLPGPLTSPGRGASDSAREVALPQQQAWPWAGGCRACSCLGLGGAWRRRRLCRMALTLCEFSGRTWGTPVRLPGGSPGLPEPLGLSRGRPRAGADAQGTSRPPY